MDFPDDLQLSAKKKMQLRYGENPHQEAALYIDQQATGPSVTQATQIQGKELSFNNIADADAAFVCVAEFTDAAAVIVKHMNPCGVAIGASAKEAYQKAFACDPVSAFGGIVAFNREVTAEVASELVEIFLEVVIAPAIAEDAKAILAGKPNVRVLVTGGVPDPARQEITVRSIAGGFLVQTNDNQLTSGELKTVTKREPTEEEMRDMQFAFAVCKHVKSNAIVYAKAGATVGIGAGQMSRVISAKIAVIKAAEAGLSLQGSVMASDAFFPFADSVEAAAAAGATAIIQPGGSKNDQESIDAANKHGIAMVFTGMRHFRH